MRTKRAFKISDPTVYCIACGQQIHWKASQQIFVLMKTPGRRLLSPCSDDVFKTYWSKRIYSPYTYVFRRRLDQDRYIRLGHTSSIRFLAKLSLRLLQGAFKVFWRHIEDILKILSRNSCHLLGGLGDVFKTTSKRPKKMSSRLLLLTCLQDVFETYSTRFWDLLRRQLSTNRFA